MVKRISGEETNVLYSVAYILDKGLMNAREEQVLMILEDVEFTQEGHPCGKLFSF